MPRPDPSPKILAQGSTARGVRFQLRRDPPGTLEVPGLENLLISIHVGPAAKLVCRRDGRLHHGTAVHGDIDIIPARTPSRWEMQDENDMALLLSVPETLLRAVAEESGLDGARMEFRNRYQIRDAELEALCGAMTREVELDGPSGPLYLDGLTLAAASRLVARHSSVAMPAEDSKGGLSGRRLKQVLALIEDDLAGDLTLEKIAAAAGASPSHAAALFRMAMGVSIHQYVIQRRVERAKNLLMRGEMSMAEIALAAGFTHQSHMARHMRRVLGMAPGTVRRLMAAPH
jgi:AraC family transcriptional regulator